MLIKLTEDCLDRWLGDFSQFSYDFLYCTKNYAKAAGYHFDSDSAALKVAHDNWVAQCEKWRTTIVMPNSNGLSHLKMMAILLSELSSVRWLKALYEYESQERDAYVFSGTADELKRTRDDINGGREKYLGFLFATWVINWFEQGRVDKVGPFVVRLTRDLEHDILVYLHSDQQQAIPIFLILKALYIREDRDECKEV